MAEQKRSWIQPDISVGNLLVPGEMIVSIAIGWARLESGLADHDRRIEELEVSEKSLMKDRMAEARDLVGMRADLRWAGTRWRVWKGSGRRGSETFADCECEFAALCTKVRSADKSTVRFVQC